MVKCMRRLFSPQRQETPLYLITVPIKVAEDRTLLVIIKAKLTVRPHEGECVEVAEIPMEIEMICHMPHLGIVELQVCRHDWDELIPFDDICESDPSWKVEEGVTPEEVADIIPVLDAIVRRIGKHHEYIVVSENGSKLELRTE